MRFSPLRDSELEELFISYEKIKKECSIDYIGLNHHGELFEFNLFSTKNLKLRIDNPTHTNKWENEPITDETIISKWKHCPLDSTSNNLFKFAFMANDCNKEKCLDSFYKELGNPKNLYSYIYFNDLEHYFLLYCPSKEKLYYIRVKL